MITGIEQVLDKNLCAGGTIGLLTNHTGVMASGVPNWKVLRFACCNLKAIFGPERLREHMVVYDLPGVVFTSQYFTPTFSKFKGQSCQGACAHMTDALAFLPLQTGIALLHAIHKLYPSDFEWKPDWDHEGRCFMDKLLGSPKTVTTEPAYGELRERIGLYHEV